MKVLQSMCLVLFVTFGGISSAQAVGTNQLIKWLDGESSKSTCKAANLYFKGLFDGLVSTNRLLSIRKKPKLFCRTALTIENAENILRRYARKGGKNYAGKDDVSIALLYALQKSFPCEK